MNLHGLPNDPAAITSQGRLTYSGLEAHIALCMPHFASSGLIPKQNVAMLMPPSPQCVVLLATLLRYGATVCPLSTRLPDDGVEEALATLGADALFETDRAVGRGPNGMLPLHYSAIRPDDDLAEDEEPFTLLPADPQSPSLAVFTSGSSGSPKAVVLSTENIIASASAMNRIIPLASGDSWLLSLPLYHVGGLSILFRCFHAGAAVVIPDEKQPLLDSLRTTECTHVSLVATQLYRLMQDKEGTAALANLKAVMLGGSAVPETLVRQAVDAGIALHTSYGMTETAAAISCTRANAKLDDLLTSGHPIHPDAISISDDGRIRARGPALFQGYLNAGKFEPVVTEGGWFTTSDMGCLDDAGRVHITGRVDNMMISGGENIQPEEIEVALCAQPGVIRAVVVPETDPEFGHRPVAFVESEDPLDASHLKKALREILPGFKIPKRIEPWPPNAPEGGIKANRSWFKAHVD